MKLDEQYLLCREDVAMENVSVPIKIVFRHSRIHTRKHESRLTAWHVKSV